MAKAALNMMTLTSAPDYAAQGIFMNAVDTGWVTDEDPIAHSLRKQQDTISSLRSISSMARRACAIRSSRGSSPASTCGGNS